MATATIQLIKGAWTQITTADKNGKIKHISGGTVIYTQQSALPTAEPIDTPRSTETNKNEERSYWGVGASDFIYAYALNSDAVLTVDPAEV